MPSRKEVHIDAALSNIAVSYRGLGFVADKVFPVVKVQKESDKFYKFAKEELLDDDDSRAPSALAKEFEYGTDTDTYSAEEYARLHYVDDRIISNSDPAIQPLITATKKLTKKIQLGYERRVAGLAMGTGITAAVVATKWDANAATAVIIARDITTGKQSVRGSAGEEPNSLLVNDQVADTLMNVLANSATNATIKDWLMLGMYPAQMFNLEFIVASGRYNSAKKGAAEVLSRIWADMAVIFYKDANPTIDSGTVFGYTLRARDWQTKRWYSDERTSEAIRVSVIQDEKVVSSSAAYQCQDVIT